MVLQHISDLKCEQDHYGEYALMNERVAHEHESVNKAIARSNFVKQPIGQP